MAGEIVYIASEASPFAATGGLGEVMGSLPGSVAGLGHEVHVILPFYSRVAAKNLPLTKSFDLLHVSLAGKDHYFSVLSFKNNQVNFHFVDYQEYFHRDGLYEDGHRSYADNWLRFGFFCYAAIETSRALGLQPAAFHVHDWPTALVPAILHAHYAHEPLFRKARVILTIHNLAFQGVFDREVVSKLHLPGYFFYPGDMEHQGRANFLKSGIAHASAVTTVSPSYAREILFPENGQELDFFLREQSYKISGILNGIDLDDYNPATDRHIAFPYKTLAGKKKNKLALQEELGLEKSTGPLLALVSRMHYQKGVDLVLEGIGHNLVQNPDSQLLVMGSGEGHYETGFHYLGLHFPGRVAYFREFNVPLARKIYAAADIYLMPSRFEPCGLGQMIAARYGALPLVHSVGGLKDTIQPLPAKGETPDPAQAEGFCMGYFSTYDLQLTVQHAMGLFDSQPFAKAQQRNMGVDFSWQRSARQYIQLYLPA